MPASDFEPVRQLRGNLAFAIDKADLTETTAQFSNVITVCELATSRTTLTVPVTFGTDEEDDLADKKKRTLTLNFMSAIGVPESLHNLLADVIETETAECWFAGSFQPGTVSESNPLFVVQFRAVSIKTGGTRAQLRQQSVTYPCVAGTYERLTTPLGA